MGFNVDDLSDKEYGRMCRARYNRLKDAFDNGLVSEHPAVTWNKTSATLRALRDGAASGELEKTDRDEPTGDDPPDFKGKPANPERNGGELARAQDRAPRMPRVSADGRIHHEVAVDDDRIVYARRR